jgi:hypothetical protein
MQGRRSIETVPYHTPTQLPNTAKRSATDPPKAQAQQFDPLGGYLLKPRALYGSQFVHLSLSVSLSLSVTFPCGVVNRQTFFNGQTFKLVLL